MNFQKLNAYFYITNMRFSRNYLMMKMIRKNTKFTRKYFNMDS